MNHIEVLRWYTGVRTNEQPILAGIYAVDDERLFGLAEYLVKNGHARYAAAPAPVEVPVEETEDVPLDDAPVAAEDMATDDAPVEATEDSKPAPKGRRKPK